MHPLIALLPLLLGTAAPLPDGGPGPGFVSLDGGDVPVVAPAMTPSVAGMLAPELVSDGGQMPDGGERPVLVPQTLSVYQVDFPPEAALTAGFLGLYVMVDVLIKPSLAYTPSCLHRSSTGVCDPADLSPFDRYAVGKQSAPWQTFSDIALAVSIGAPLVYLALESIALPTQEPWGDFFNDALVVAEAVALNLTLETVLKFTFRRPRPIDYVSAEAANNPDAQLSLPSGHVTVVAAATTALTTTVFMRHPESKLRYVVLGAGFALSLLTAFARVQSGQHFPTDTITGLLIGGAAGFAVPYFHRRPLGITPSVAFDPATGASSLALSGRF